jgi:hypothetical protein
MRDFKFFEDNEEDDDDEWVCASWIWHTIPMVARYQIVIEEHYGIRSFLSQFPSHQIISVHSIVGPDGYVRNRHNEGIGWGFDISRDLIKITWIRFL